MQLARRLQQRQWTRDHLLPFRQNTGLPDRENIHGFESIASFPNKKPNCQTRTNNLLHGLDAISAVQSKTPIGQTDTVFLVTLDTIEAPFSI
jgi:hypothetical protein